MRRVIVIIVLIAVGVAGIVIGLRAQSSQDPTANLLTATVEVGDVRVTATANGEIVDEFTYSLGPGAPATLTLKAGVATTATPAAGASAYKTRKIDVRVGEKVKRKDRLIKTRDALDQVAKVKAPFPGIIREINTDIRAAAGSNAIVMGTGRVLAAVGVSEYDIDKVSRGLKVDVSLAAIDQNITGRVVQINPAPDDTSGVTKYQVLIKPSKLPKSVKVGMSVGATIVKDEALGVLAIPTSAISQDGDQTTVDVVRDKQVVTVPVTVGLVGDARTEITSGLAEGDVIVVGAAGSLPEIAPFAPRGGGGGGNSNGGNTSGGSSNGGGSSSQ